MPFLGLVLVLRLRPTIRARLPENTDQELEALTTLYQQQHQADLDLDRPVKGISITPFLRLPVALAQLWQLLLLEDNGMQWRVAHQVQSLPEAAILGFISLDKAFQATLTRHLVSKIHSLKTFFSV
jgi:hypothetical protein